MTLEEKVICETYTGICFTSSEERSEVYRYAEKLMGRPVYTHEFPALADQLKERSKTDFIRVCRGEYAADVAPVRHGEWELYEGYSKLDGWIVNFQCSACRKFHFYNGELRRYKYCPECGAKMDGGSSHE